jgi:hypothetical protein
MVDVIQKSREIRLVEALATFPPKGKVLIPNLNPGYSGKEIITKRIKMNNNNLQGRLLNTAARERNFAVCYCLACSKSSMHHRCSSFHFTQVL